MQRAILRYGDEVLHRPALPVREWTPELQRLIDDMIETMHTAPGVGLAAPQVGVPLRVFVVDLSVGHEHSDVIVMVNPEFVEREGLQLEEEGCLSLPGMQATVARPAHVVVRGYDRDGREAVLEGRGLLARAFQHEMDHLDGRLYLDRLPRLRRALIAGRLTRLRRKGRW
jgi:peptide deformylase